MCDYIYILALDTVVYLHAVHGFTNVSYDVEEGERLDTGFELNVKGMTNFPNLNLLGSITTEPGPNTSESY